MVQNLQNGVKFFVLNSLNFLILKISCKDGEKYSFRALISLTPSQG